MLYGLASARYLSEFQTANIASLCLVHGPRRGRSIYSSLCCLKINCVPFFRQIVMPKLLYVWYYPSIDQARSASGGCRSIDVHICRIQIKFQRTMGQRKGARMAFYVIKDILASTLDTLLCCLQQKTNNQVRL